MIIKFNFYPTCDYLRKKIFREKDLVKLFKINHRKEMKIIITECIISKMGHKTKLM